MAKVTVYESVDGKVNTLTMESVDAREAVQNDPKRYTFDKPGAKKPDPDAGPSVPRYKVVHAGNKKYNVIDTANDTIIESGWDKDAAEAKAAELGGGHATTSPNT